MEYLKDVLALCGTEASGGISEGTISLAPFEANLVKHLIKEHKIKTDKGDLMELGGKGIEIKCATLVAIAKATPVDYKFPADLVPAVEE